MVEYLLTELRDPFESNDVGGYYVRPFPSCHRRPSARPASSLLWPLDFHLVSPDTGGPDSSLMFTLQLKTTYDATGRFVTAQVIESRGGCITPCLLP